MENIKQENTQEAQQENTQEAQQENTQEVQQENTQEVQQENSSQEQSVRVAQLVPPKEALERMKELERKYRETIERENK